MKLSEQFAALAIEANNDHTDFDGHSAGAAQAYLVCARMVEDLEKEELEWRNKYWRLVGWTDSLVKLTQYVPALKSLTEELGKISRRPDGVDSGVAP